MVLVRHWVLRKLNVVTAGGEVVTAGEVDGSKGKCNGVGRVMSCCPASLS